MNKIKNLAELNRPQVIEALRGRLNPKWYHESIYWPTPMLKALITFYDEGGTDAELARFMPRRIPILAIELTEINVTVTRKSVDGIKRT